MQQQGDQSGNGSEVTKHNFRAPDLNLEKLLGRP